MADAQPAQGLSRTPADFLRSIKGKPVVVKLNSGADYRGVLACLDGYMNIAMEQTEVRRRVLCAVCCV
jgi:U6 snRNA-associated Sm-like protein LSm6